MLWGVAQVDRWRPVPWRHREHTVQGCDRMTGCSSEIPLVLLIELPGNGSPGAAIQSEASRHWSVGEFGWLDNAGICRCSGLALGLSLVFQFFIGFVIGFSVVSLVFVSLVFQFCHWFLQLSLVFQLSLVLKLVFQFRYSVQVWLSQDVRSGRVRGGRFRMHSPAIDKVQACWGGADRCKLKRRLNEG